MKSNNKKTSWKYLIFIFFIIGTKTWALDKDIYKVEEYAYDTKAYESFLLPSKDNIYNIFTKGYHVQNSYKFSLSNIDGIYKDYFPFDFQAKIVCAFYHEGTPTALLKLGVMNGINEYEIIPSNKSYILDNIRNLLGDRMDITQIIKTKSGYAVIENYRWAYLINEDINEKIKINDNMVGWMFKLLETEKGILIGSRWQQTIGFSYYKWNDNKHKYYSSPVITNYNTTMEIEDIEEDSEGNIYCVANYQEGTRRSYIVKFDSNGHVKWGKYFFPEPNKNSSQFLVKDLTLDQNKLWITGSEKVIENSKYNTDYYLARLNNDGEVIHSIKFGGASGDFAYYSVADGDSIYTIGSSESAPLENGFFTSGRKYTKKHSGIWIVESKVLPFGIVVDDKKIVNNKIHEITKPTDVSFVTSNKDAHIHYTLDGSVPTFSSHEFEAPIKINSTTLVKAKIYSKDYTETYSTFEYATLAKAELKLKINNEGGGNLEYEPIKDAYLLGDVVEFNVIENTGWNFTGYYLNDKYFALKLEDKSFSIKILSDTNITPVFKTKVKLNALGGGQIISRSGDEYTSGTTMTLVAVPDDSHYFLKWAGDTDGESEEINLDDVKYNDSYSALFAEIPAESKVIKIKQNANGKAVLQPYKKFYQVGDEVTIIPKAISEDYIFSKWLGIETPSDGSNPVITVKDNLTIEPVFISKSITIPEILSSPISGIYQYGNEVSFKLKIKSEDKVKVTWTKNGAVLPEWADKIFISKILDMSDAGVYQARISNSRGSVYSEEFNIIVKGIAAKISIDTYAGIIIDGTIGARYKVEFSEKLEQGEIWKELEIITLNDTPFLWVDTFKRVKETRYYRVVLID